MEMKSLLKESWDEFITRFAPLTKATGPYILASILAGALVNIFFANLGTFTSFIISVAISVLESMVILSGLKYLYSERGIDLEISSNRIMIYLFAAMYVGIASGLGFVFFVIPGIIIMAVTFLMPIYILKDSQNPIEAIASSASIMKECFIQVTLFLLGIWVAIALVVYMVGFIFGFIPIPDVIISSITAAISLVIGLYPLTVMVALYTRLESEHNNLSKRDAVTGNPS